MASILRDTPSDRTTSINQIRRTRQTFRSLLLRRALNQLAHATQIKGPITSPADYARAEVTSRCTLERVLEQTLRRDRRVG